MTKSQTLQAILDYGLLAVLRAPVGGDPMLRAVEAVAQGGIPCVEITMTTPDALSTIAEAVRRFSAHGLVIGAGTVITAEDCRAAVEAGAQYVITPVVSEEAIREAQVHDIPVFCGAFTPTEVHTAWTLGSDMVKVFPASVGGPGYLKALKGPLPHVPMVPTGGVTIENMAAFIKAGAAALAIGGNLAGADLIRQGDTQRMTANAEAFAQAFREFAPNRP